ncbi:MAG: hypothetical protein [Wendovervirus sonii]|uniref:Peptidase n=1 Tax=phage Lak_Megaphage_Sonny TaxID=3109229 RepID=A0ABZ0Z2N7_9CAUD|nr:MAG: hypothetical protein [phage Lak_Megaphage_Sonny]
MVLSEKIHKIINEELSVSLNVEKEANKIKKLIINDLKNASVGFINTLKYKENTISYKIFDLDYKINYKVFTNINPTSDKLYGTTYINAHEIDLNLCMSGGIPYPAKFDDIIFHEILHVYQYSMNKKDYLSNLSYLNLYNKVIEVMKSGSNDNDLKLANALYMSFDFEQDAMAHGLYGILKQYFKERLYDMFLKSEEYAFLSDMHDIIENPDFFDFSLFNLEKEETLKFINKKYKRYMQKLTHVYQKVYQEKNYVGI